MPTGYTSKLCEEDVSFQEYALSCARAFGALVMMRDDPHDKPISRFEPTDYHEKAVVEAEAKIKSVEAMSDDDVLAEQDKENAKYTKLQKESDEKKAAARRRLVDMRSKVSDWKPPTSDHDGLKKFMLEQIDITMPIDGTSGTYYQEQLTTFSAQECRRTRIAEARKDILYHKKEHAKEVERTDERNAWVEDLRGSLKE